MRSVHGVLSGAPWVLGITDGRASKPRVTIRLGGNNQVKIVQGMADGVAVPHVSGLVTDQRVCR